MIHHQQVVVKTVMIAYARKNDSHCPSQCPFSFLKTLLL